MKSDKKQTLVMIGIALLAIAGVLLYVSLSQPKIYVEDSNSYTYSSDNEQYINSNSENQTSESVSSERSTQSETKTSVNFPVNINTATVSELTAVPNLGEKRASDIIAYRNAIGGYTSVSQIKNIKGFGETLYSKVAPYLTV